MKILQPNQLVTNSLTAYREAIEAGPLAAGETALAALGALAGASAKPPFPASKSEVVESGTVLGMCGIHRQVGELDLA